MGPVRAALDEMLRPLGCRVEMVDLRWGVAAHNTDDAAATQRKILDVCLSEIARSRPLFVGLVGHRYGWIPPEDRARRVAQEAGLTLDVRGRSVTELEFIHGASGEPHEVQPVFFVRDFARGKKPPGWQDSDTGLVHRSQTLRNWAMNHPRAQVHRYRVRTDSTRVRDLREFESLAVDVLGPLVVRQAREMSELREQDPVTAVESLFFADRTAVVEGRDLLIADVVTAVENGRSVCLTGPSGAGKSAVWCAVVQRLQAAGLRVVAVPVGAGPDTTGERAVVHRLAVKLGAQIPDELRTTEQLRNWWRALIANVGDIVIAVDSLDSLDEGATREEIGFLTSLPDNATIVVSTTLEWQRELLAHAGTRRIAVDDLPPAAVAEAAAHMAGELRRDLPTQAIQSLASRPRSPLWLSLAVGELMALDEDDFAEVDPSRDAVSELAKLVTRTVHRLPDGVDGVIDLIVARAAERYGSENAAAIMRALALSRSGLRSSDLAGITGLPEVVVAGLRRAFAGMVEIRGAGGRLGFVHGAVKAAVTRVHLSAPLIAPTHARIANHLATLRDNDPIREDDLLWHTLHSGGSPSAGPILNGVGGADSERSIRARRVIARALVRGIDLGAVTNGLDHKGLWILMGTESSGWSELPLEARRRLRDVTLRHARALQAANPRSDLSVRAVAVALGNLGDVETDAGDVQRARDLYDESLQIARSRWRATPDTPSQRDLSVALRRASAAAEQSGDFDRARELSAEALEITRNLREARSGNLQAQRDVGISLLDVGAQAQARGDNAAAQAAYEEALRIWRDLVTADPDNESVQRDASVALNKVGELARQTGAYTRAKAPLEEALRIRRKILAANPGSSQAMRDVCVSLTNVGQLARATGATEEASENFDESLALARKVFAADPANAIALRDVSVSLGRVGQLALDRGQTTVAAEAFEEALHIRRRLSALDPENAEATRDIAVTLEDLGTVANTNKDHTRARDRFEEALQLWRQLRRLDPASVKAARNVMTALNDVGQAARMDGALGRAREAYTESVEIARDLLTRKPQDTAALRDLKLALDNLGEVNRRAKDFDSARKTCEESLRVAQAINSVETGPRARRELWSAQTLLGRLADEIGDFHSARIAFDEALSLARELHASRPTVASTRDLSGSLRRLGDVALRTGDARLADACHQAVRELAAPK
ncbi:hypothetical protein AU195_13790 [Mycobacterium sp. IS-1496]|nr:hypothetical protein AU195_13790 [Mycobacterium sp. IS-1496]